MYLDRMLLGLNINQKDAVTSDPRGKLQIIAGPGTGKTKVLVSRVVFLLVECKIPPQRIVVTTFTKKAANEMIERLKLILGIQHSDIDISKLIIGTFHSICFRIIMTYGKLIGKEKFRIADERDSNQILKEVIEKCNTLGFKEWDLEPYKKPGNSSLDERKVKRQISKLKSMAVSPEAYFATSGAGKSSTKRPRFNAFIYFMYSSYQASLSYDNLLDFDDCLFTCYELISSHPVLLFVEHVLVDEFQDTNEIQLQLMYEFANSLGNLTIVGDPDQSIYGFRDAQVINFRKMVDHYGEPNIRIISLNENYRSTSDILNFSENIMREQKESRFAKELKSQFKATFPPVYSTFDSQEMEAEWICSEIEEIIKLPGLFSHKDIAILVRSAFQTKALEDVLVRRRIPYFMVRGKAFWERKEVLSILDYMRIVGNDNDRMAYLRTINYPKRGIGETSMEEITTYLNKKADQTVYHSLIEITEGKTDCKLSKSVISKLANYLNIISKYRAIINSEIGSFDLSSLFDNIYEESGLKDEVASNKTPDEATGNVMEVKRQFCEFVPVDETLPEIVGGKRI